MRIPALLIAALIALGPAAHAADAPLVDEAPPAAVTAPPPAPPAAGQENAPPGATSDVVEAPPAPAVAPEAAPTPAPIAAPAAAQAPVAHSPVYLSMDFTDVDLPVLIKFMSEQTKKNFIFDERVQGKITIISPRRVTLDEDEIGRASCRERVFITV